MTIRPLDKADYGYALVSWREGAHEAPTFHKVPWSYYKDAIVPEFKRILDDPETVVLGAYTTEDQLVGWIALTRGKRVHTVHWVHVKYELDGKRARRHGVMTALLNAADLGSRFVYTLRARRDRAKLSDGSITKSLDESLVAALRARGVTATYMALKEWLK